jgi:TetR/AcrR family transcriptional repressor of nem operon
MRKSKEETAVTWRRIVGTAAREFRRNGIHATGLADVMAAAGLTHGGFYRHFGSKEELVAEASAAGMESILDRADAAAGRAGDTSGLEAIIEAYLATDHRDDRSEGCPLAGLGSELARADDETREVVSARILKFLDLIAAQMSRRKREAANSKAILLLSAMVGAVTLSRIAVDPELSAAILRETKHHLANS